MFGKKKEELKYTICFDCGCMIADKKEKTVKREYFDGFLTQSLETYCGRCKPPYDIVVEGISAQTHYRTVPTSKVKVTEDGREVKSKK